MIAVDSCYSENFVLKNVDKDELENIEAVISKFETFHDNIKLGSIENVQKFTNENTNFKFAYNTINKSATTIALESKQFEVYSFLISEGFSPGIDQNFQDALADLSRAEKSKIREVTNQKYFKTSDDPNLYQNRFACFKVIRRS